MIDKFFYKLLIELRFVVFFITPFTMLLFGVNQLWTNAI